MPIGVGTNSVNPFHGSANDNTTSRPKRKWRPWTVSLLSFATAQLPKWQAAQRASIQHRHTVHSSIYTKDINQFVIYVRRRRSMVQLQLAKIQLMVVDIYKKKKILTAGALSIDREARRILHFNWIRSFHVQFFLSVSFVAFLRFISLNNIFLFDCPFYCIFLDWIYGFLHASRLRAALQMNEYSRLFGVSAVFCVVDQIVSMWMNESLWKLYYTEQQTFDIIVSITALYYIYIYSSLFAITVLISTDRHATFASTSNSQNIMFKPKMCLLHALTGELNRYIRVEYIGSMFRMKLPNKLIRQRLLLCNIPKILRLTTNNRSQSEI